MLIWIIPAVMFAITFFTFVALIDRGDVAVALGFGSLMMIPAFLLSMVIVPAIATGYSDEIGVRWEKDILGDINVYDDDGVTNIRFSPEGKKVQTSNLDGVEIFRNEISKPYAKYVCDETPDWAAPYTIGTCTTELHIPSDMKLSMEVM